MPLDDTRLAIKALAYYLVEGGRVSFLDTGATHPGRRKTFTLSFTILDAQHYDRVWRRLMVQDQTGRR